MRKKIIDNSEREKISSLTQNRTGQAGKSNRVGLTATSDDKILITFFPYLNKQKILIYQNGRTKYRKTK